MTSHSKGFIWMKLNVQEAAVRQVFWQISENTLKNTYAFFLDSFLIIKRESGSGVFLSILRNFSEIFAEHL